MKGGEWFAGLRAVLGRELGAIFGSPIAYVTTIGGILALNSLFMNGFFLAGRLDMGPLFEMLPYLCVLLIPAITMRTWAEERKARTFELWMTLPLTGSQVVLGKYLATMVLYSVFLVGTLPAVVMLYALGEPDGGAIFCGYVGALLLGGMFAAFGSFLSALSSDQITAFVASALLAFLFVVTGQAQVVAVIDGLIPGLGVGTILHDHFSVLPVLGDFQRGILSLSGLLYFVLLSAAFLWLNVRAVREDRD